MRLHQRRRQYSVRRRTRGTAGWESELKCGRTQKTTARKRNYRHLEPNYCAPLYKGTSLFMIADNHILPTAYILSAVITFSHQPVFILA